MGCLLFRSSSSIVFKTTSIALLVKFILKVFFCLFGAIVSEIVSLISFLDCFLPMNNSTSNFLYHNLTSCNLADLVCCF